MTRRILNRLFQRAGVTPRHAATFTLFRVRPLLMQLESRMLPTNWVVTNLSDHDPGSLRDRLGLAQNGDSISFDTALTGTITLSSSQLNVVPNIGILGPGAGKISVSGNDVSRVFQVFGNVSISGLTVTAGAQPFGAGILVSNNKTLTLIDCAFTNNIASGDGSAIYGSYNSTLNITNTSFSGNSGGAVQVGKLNVTNGSFSNNTGGTIHGGSSVTVSNSVFSNNSGAFGGAINGTMLSVSQSTFFGNTASVGGAIFAHGATVTDSVFEGNTANEGGAIRSSGSSTLVNSHLHQNSAGSGGAIYISDGGSLLVESSTVGNNDATNGGGIYARGALTVVKSTISGNSATNIGGGVYAYTSTTFTNSTVYQNSAVNNAGGILAGSTLGLTSSTVAMNSTWAGGGGIHVMFSGTTVSLHNSIIAQNYNGGGPDDIWNVSGAIITGNYNLIGIGGSGGLNGQHNLIGIADPGLAGLAENGGPTATVELLPESPALNSGDPFLAGTQDQRGTVRGGPVSIGAFQATASGFGVAGFPSPITSGVQGTFSVVATDVFGKMAYGYVGDVVFSSSDLQAVLPAISSLTDGSGTFTATLNTVGTHSLTATDTVHSNITGMQSGILVLIPAPYTVTTVADSGQGSLRQAIINTNNNPGTNTITFSIPGTGVHTISLNSPLPDITDPVIIDGYSQPGSSPNTLAVGNNAALLIELSGNNAGGNANGLTLINVYDTTIKGLVINLFSGYGIYVDGIGQDNGGIVIEGNFIGTDPTGSLDRGNDLSNVNLYQTIGVKVGGNTPAARNLISASYSGITTRGTYGTHIQGNYIGTDRHGTSKLGNTFEGVDLQGDHGAVIGGLSESYRNVISGNNRDGILLWDPSTTLNIVLGNFIGVDAWGNAVLPNSGDGVHLSNATGNTIGGTIPGARNILSGNLEAGVHVSGTGSTGNNVQGNFIGTNAAGTSAFGNGAFGVYLDGVSNNGIGGSAPGSGNVISGNLGEGVIIVYGSDNAVRGNYIGTNHDGTADIGNVLAGVYIAHSKNNVVGGSASGARNVISGNNTNGIVISHADATGNLVQGNLIGTDKAGILPLPNSFDGVVLDGSTGNVVGGFTGAERNVISGNLSNGVRLVQAAANLVRGNYIGTDVSGENSLGNLQHGVLLISDASGNKIGGTTSGAPNRIAYNGQSGIRVLSGSGNSFRQNEVYSNGLLGIDIGPEGVTLNDPPPDGDIGANGLQNFPAITTATNTGGNIVITGSLASSPNTFFAVEFYGLGVCDPSGYGEGESFLGMKTFTTSASGRIRFAIVVPGSATYVVATAIDSAGNTSEFSKCMLVGGGAAPGGGNNLINSADVKNHGGVHELPEAPPAFDLMQITTPSRPATESVTFDDRSVRPDSEAELLDTPNVQPPVARRYTIRFPVTEDTPRLIGDDLLTLV